MDSTSVQTLLEMTSPGIHEEIESGFWTDHSSGARYLLVTEKTAVTISNIVAIMLTLTLARLLIFVKLIFLYFHHRNRNLHDGNERLHIRQLAESSAIQSLGLRSPSIVLQDLPLAYPRPAGRLQTSRIAENIDQATSEQNAAARIFRSTLREYVLVDRLRLDNPPNGRIAGAIKKVFDIACNIKENWLEVFGGLSESLLLFSVFVGYQIIALTCANQILGPTTAHSRSQHAGFWFPDVLDPENMVNTSIIPQIYDYYTEMTFKSVSYAENCYKDDSQPEECSLFNTPKLPFSKVNNVTCPFLGDMCLQGPQSAYELTTGFLDSRSLGINEKHACEYQIRKVCAPLRTDEPYIVSKRVGDTDDNRVEYYYGDGRGTMNQGNLSFVEVVGDPKGDLKGQPRYSIVEIRTPFLNPLGSEIFREWRPEVLVKDSAVTLYFIRPVHLMYTAPSLDPIFPATVSAQAMSNGDVLYVTPYQRSTVLACADSIQIRHPVSHEIWHPRYQNVSQLADSKWQYPRVHSSLHMVNMSYLASETFESRFEGMAEHFDAPRRIRYFFSSSLHQEQWKLEVDKMFTTKLALLQFHTLSIAQGQGRKLPRARNLLREYDVDAKGKILFSVPGWRNIKVDALITALTVCILVFVATVQKRLVRNAIDPLVQKALLWTEKGWVKLLGFYFKATRRQSRNEWQG